MSFRVVKILGDENPGSGQLRKVHVVGTFDSREAADAKKRELDSEKRRTYENRSLPGETRKKAIETDYGVWSDKDVDDAQRGGTDVG